MNCRRGDFVDCLFPFAERAGWPGPVRHIAYVQTLVRLRGGEVRALVMLTTTSPRMIAAIPKGLSVAIDRASSQRMGMRNAFVIDVHRLALLPLDPAWFPDIGDERFVIARADERLRGAITKRYADMLARHPMPALLLGPEAPG